MEVNIMKKLLSVLLAVLMLFSTVALSASAAAPVTDPTTADTLRDRVGQDHIVIQYNLFDFKTKYAQYTYDVDSNCFAYIDGISGTFYQVPENASQLYVGYTIALPEVTAPEGKQFNGWKCATHAEGLTLAAGVPVKITEDMLALATNNVVVFEVVWGSAAPEEDTMSTVVDILCKIFGALLGILMYNGNTEAGVQMMKELLGGVLG